MGCFVSLIALLAFLGVGCRVVWAEASVWISIGPFGGNVDALAMDPQNLSPLYAVAAGKLFKSTDRDGSWSVVKTGIPGGFGFLATDPQNPTPFTWEMETKRSKAQMGEPPWSDSGLLGFFPVYVLVFEPQTPSAGICWTLNHARNCACK